MGEENEKRNRSREMHNLSLEIEKYPRDLLQIFMSKSETEQSQDDTTPTTQSGEKTEEEIELNLGLSLGGRFGVDKNAKKKLLRSSSIAGSIPMFREIDMAATPTARSAPASTYPPLIRTSSLPTETEEEWRKRKELQTLRRMEAKRRRSEKQRSSSSNVAGVTINQKVEKMELSLEENKQISGAATPFGMPSWAAAARQVIFGGSGGGGGGVILQGLVQPCSQGSVESQGGSSSGMSELESKPLQGSSGGGEAKSPVNNWALQDCSSQEAAGSSGTNTNESACRTSKSEVENLSKKLDSQSSRGINTLEDMPCVFTKGDGPNGRRVEGILYKYGKGEEVRIMCVCHGSFLSPAEFVKHAGGGDVDHPLRHIVVNPSAAPFP